MSVVVVINTAENGPKMIGTIKEEEIESTLDLILNEYKKDYGEKEVLSSKIKVNSYILEMYHTIYKIYKIECKSYIGYYTVWIEFHKKDIKDVDTRQLRNLLM